MNNMIKFPKPQNNGLDLLFQKISEGMIRAQTKEDDAMDAIFEEIETLFHAVGSGQLPAAEASAILIARLA